MALCNVPAQQSGNHAGMNETLRTSAELMTWQRVYGRRLVLARLPAKLGSLPLVLGAVSELIFPTLKAGTISAQAAAKVAASAPASWSAW